MQQLTDANIDARYRLYDNLGRTIDRYTLVDMRDFQRGIWFHQRRRYAWLWFSEWMQSYCEHCQVIIWPHLGKRLTPSSFPDIRRIISDIF